MFTSRATWTSASAGISSATRAVGKLSPPPPSPPTSASCIILQKYKSGQWPCRAAPLTSHRPHAACIPDSYTPVVAAHTTHVPCRVVELLSLLDKASGQVVAKVQRDVSRCVCTECGLGVCRLCCYVVLTSAAAAGQCEAGRCVCGAHGAAAAAGSRVVRRLCSSRAHLLVRPLYSPLHARHRPRCSRAPAGSTADA